MIYQKEFWLINFNLNQSVGNRSCSISVVLH